MWNLPGAGIEFLSPALAGRFLTTGPPGKSWSYFRVMQELVQTNDDFFTLLIFQNIIFLFAAPGLSCNLCETF